MEKVKFNDVMSRIFDVVAIFGIVFLAYHGKDGWGWLIFLLLFKNN